MNQNYESNFRPQSSANQPVAWTEQGDPNPGVDVAFRLGLPVLVIDQWGGSHVVRNRTEYEERRRER